MSDLYLVEILLDRISMLRFADSQGVDLYRDEDAGYATHAWLLAAFGPGAPKPFRIYDRPGSRLRILGYSSVPADDLRGYLREFSPPLAAGVCQPDWIATKAVPGFPKDRVLRFETLCCPVVRKSRSGIEKDAFLAAVDRLEPGRTIRRDEAYAAWFRGLAEAAAEILAVELAGFRLVRMLRRSPDGTQRKAVHLRRPVARLTGRLRVRDAETFRKLLVSGVGRHTAFGYGMLLLAPP